MSIEAWVGIAGVAIAIIAIFVTIWLSKKQSNSQITNSPSITARDLSVGGNITVGNTTTHNYTPAPPPEIQLQLNGRGAKLAFEGHIESKAGISLVVEFIDIDGSKTELDQRFTRLLPLRNLRFPHEILEKKKDGDITISVRYKTLHGEVYEYSQKAEQQSMAIGKFNVIPTGSPTIKKIATLPPKEQEIFATASVHGGRVNLMKTDQAGEWVRIGQENFYFKDNWQETMAYVSALESLVAKDAVKHVSGNLYVLTGRQP